VRGPARVSARARLPRFARRTPAEAQAATAQPIIRATRPGRAAKAQGSCALLGRRTQHRGKEELRHSTPAPAYPPMPRGRVRGSSSPAASRESWLEETEPRPCRPIARAAPPPVTPFSSPAAAPAHPACPDHGRSRPPPSSPPPIPLEARLPNQPRRFCAPHRRRGEAKMPGTAPLPQRVQAVPVAGRCHPLALLHALLCGESSKPEEPSAATRAREISRAGCGSAPRHRHAGPHTDPREEGSQPAEVARVSARWR